MSIFTSFLDSAAEANVFDDYSDNHLLKQAIHGEFGLFEKHLTLKNDGTNMFKGGDAALTFLANLSTSLMTLGKYFGKDAIYHFLREQMSAGKNNYDENQFLRALSEVHCLRFLIGFSKLKLLSAEYEPKLQENKNPEARLNYDDGYVFDIEVKTPGFPNEYVIPNEFTGSLKPNFVLSNDERKQFTIFCEQSNFKLVMPRVLKLADFVKSASSKFIHPDNKKHFNILFVNWTYTDFKNSLLTEPINLLSNPINGFFYNPHSAFSIGVTESDLGKISAIVIYKDTFESMLFGSPIWQQAIPGRMVLMVSDKIEYNERTLLEKLFNIPAYDRSKLSGCFSFDYILKEDTEENNVIACRLAKDIYWDFQLNRSYGEGVLKSLYRTTQ